MDTATAVAATVVAFVVILVIAWITNRAYLSHLERKRVGVWHVNYLLRQGSQIVEGEICLTGEAYAPSKSTLSDWKRAIAEGNDCNVAAVVIRGWNKVLTSQQDGL